MYLECYVSGFGRKHVINANVNAWLLKLHQRETHLFSACAKSRAGFINSSVRHGWSMKNGWPSKGCSYTHIHTPFSSVLISTLTSFFIRNRFSLSHAVTQTLNQCHNMCFSILNSMLNSHMILFTTRFNYAQSFG